MIKKIQNDVFLVGFKAEANIPRTKLIIEAKKKLKEYDADLMVANDVGLRRYKENSEYNNVIIVNSNKIIQSGWRNKLEISRLIRKEVENRIR